MATGITPVMVLPGKDMNRGHGPDIIMEIGSGPKSLVGFGSLVTIGIRAASSGATEIIPLDGCLLRQMDMVTDVDI